MGLRLLICEDLSKDAQGVDYNASMIAHLNMIDPWKADPEFELPTMHLNLIKMKKQSGSVIETWDTERLAA